MRLKFIERFLNGATLLAFAHVCACARYLARCVRVAYASYVYARAHVCVCVCARSRHAMKTICLRVAINRSLNCPTTCPGRDTPTRSARLICAASDEKRAISARRVCVFELFHLSFRHGRREIRLVVSESLEEYVTRRMRSTRNVDRSYAQSDVPILFCPTFLSFLFYRI